MTLGSDFYLHSTGVLGSDERYVVAVLSKNRAAAGEDAARDVVSGATAAATALLPG